MMSVNKRYKQKELKKYLHTNKINLASLVETRMKEHNMVGIAKAIALGWEILHNYENVVNGRMWLIYDQNIYEVNKSQGFPQSLHYMVNDTTRSHQQLITIIYGFNTRGLWQELNTISQEINLSWIIIGNFNVILKPQDRQAGTNVTLNDIKDFR